ncbi:MAG: SDR family oxidoreductase [Oscillatoriophycideae cyanobacterium NC_groundwater_1537_Pr4_S-0.65um_50_18]|nr:SDR family oxidoreductase [Oscillatoriophycideae cyanobacterium NC_groundwater_1537_Pr4_S-0.65um_50_18]
MQDPRHQYPQPPFPKQPQPVPGLDSKMAPLADHGEESYTGSGKLTHRKALITGGDSGIGRAVAIAFAREGADVAISYLPSEEADAKEVIALIEQAGRKAIALPGDITNEQFCRKLVTDTVKALGGLDILVNNAGKQKSQPSLADITTEQFDQVLKTNLYSLFWITQEAATHLKPGASIINTTSIQGYDPSETLIDYAMTKSAIVSFTKSVSKQMIEQGVRVNAIAPGPFWTPLQPSGGQTQEKVEKFGSEVPLSRPGQPIEIAPVYVLLASQEGSYITGEVYGVTGGIGIA